MKYCDYLTYTAVDFSTDPYFLTWRWFQTEEANLFCTRFLSQYPEKSEEISLAIKIVESVVEDNKASFSNNEKERAIKRLTVKVDRHKQRKKIAISSLSAAVILACLFFFPFNNSDHLPGGDEVALIDFPEREIQLILPTGDRTSFKEDIQISYDKTGNVTVQNKAGEMLDRHESIQGPVALNRLIVPKGKRSSLLLEDGSSIWINSGTTVEFPSTFVGLDERKIKVEGEIYIEVENDVHRPFLVETTNFGVRVLGTKFNVSAYSEDPVKHVTVVEGLVSTVSGKGEKEELIGPSQQLTISGQGTTLKNVDVAYYVSWKDGFLCFESEPLGSILTCLSRYYDIQLVYGNDIEAIRCSGKLYLFDEWQVVFDNITKVSPVEYFVKNNKITFKYNSSIKVPPM